MTITVTDGRPSAPIEQSGSTPLTTTGSGQASAGSAVPSLFELLLLQQVIAKPASNNESTGSSAPGADTGNNVATTDLKHQSTTANSDGLTAAAAAILNLFVPNQSAPDPLSSVIRSSTNDTEGMQSALRPFAMSKDNSAATPFLRMFAATMSSGSTPKTLRLVATTPFSIAETGTDLAIETTANAAPVTESPAAAETADVQIANDSLLSASIPSASIPLVPVESTRSASANLPTIDLVQRQVFHFPMQGTSINQVTTASATSVRTVLPASVIAASDSSRDHDLNDLSPLPAVVPAVTVNSGAVTSSTPDLSDQLATSIAQQLAEDSAEGTTTVRLRLDREDLGTVHLHLSVNNDVVSVRIVAQDQLARQIIDGQMSDLRQALTGGGIALGQFEVTCRSGRDPDSNRSRTGQAYASVGNSSAVRGTRSPTTLESSSRSAGQLNIVA